MKSNWDPGFRDVPAQAGTSVSGWSFIKCFSHYHHASIQSNSKIHLIKKAGFPWNGQTGCHWIIPWQPGCLSTGPWFSAPALQQVWLFHGWQLFIWFNLGSIITELSSPVHSDSCLLAILGEPEPGAEWPDFKLWCCFAYKLPGYSNPLASYDKFQEDLPWIYRFIAPLKFVSIWPSASIYFLKPWTWYPMLSLLCLLSPQLFCLHPSPFFCLSLHPVAHIFFLAPIALCRVPFIYPLSWAAPLLFIIFWLIKFIQRIILLKTKDSVSHRKDSLVLVFCLISFISFIKAVHLQRRRLPWLLICLVTSVKLTSPYGTACSAPVESLCSVFSVSPGKWLVKG